jgi:hypothetical protein
MMMKQHRSTHDGVFRQCKQELDEQSRDLDEVLREGELYQADLEAKMQRV